MSARTRIALASGAALLAVACSNGEAAEADSGGNGSGGEVVEGELSDDGSTDGAGGGAEASCAEQEEVSCAGRCGSHHHPACMDDPVDPCPAPPYGAPPGEDWV